MLISITDTITQSLQLYKKNWRHFVPYMLIAFLPTVVLEIFGVMSIYLMDWAPTISWIGQVIILLILAAVFVLDIWIAIAFMRAIKNTIKQEPQIPSWKTVFGGSSRLIWPSFYVSMLVGFIILGGLILFFIPGIIFTFWYCFANYAIVFEDSKGTSALAYSKQLVVGRWWKIFLRIVIPFLLIMAVTNLLRVALVNPLSYIPFSQFSILLIQSVTATILNVLVMPLTYCVGVLVYLSAQENPVDNTPAKI